MPQSWAWAEAQYRDTPQQAQAIATATGVTLDALYRHMHVRGIRKGHRVRKLPGQTKARAYHPDVVEAQIAADNRARDAAKVARVRRYRCAECGNLSTTPVCVFGHVINVFLIA